MHLPTSIHTQCPPASCMPHPPVLSPTLAHPPMRWPTNMSSPSTEVSHVALALPHACPHPLTLPPAHPLVCPTRLPFLYPHASCPLLMCPTHPTHLPTRVMRP